MSSEPHLTFYGASGSPPNGWKVVMILEELGLDYEPVYFDLTKPGDAYTKFNPNGRLPTLIDHQNDEFKVWESDAIITYLIEKYDPERKISFEGLEDKIQLTQWLFFQASGQGPYYGQASSFLSSPVKIPSAITRYQNEVIRVLGVLERVLSKRTWLVGDKCSVADISFFTWNHVAFTKLVKDYNGFDLQKDFPAVYRWHTALGNRSAVKKVFAGWQESLSW